MARTVLLDTSFIVALENHDDPHHARAKQLDGELAAQGAILLRHWGILLEIGDGYARIGRRAKGVELLDKLVHEEGYWIAPLTEEIVDRAAALFCSRSDKEWGMTDCLSFVLMQQEGLTEALSADVHFRQAGFTPLLLG